MTQPALSSSEKLFFSSVSVSQEQKEQLYTYEALLRKWQKAVNLVSSSTLPLLWERHFLDSAQLLPVIKKIIHKQPSEILGVQKGEAQKKEIEALPHLVDFGSGAGFPALVLAILMDNPVTLVEADQRKAQFLKTVVRELGLKEVTVKTDRIEKLSSLNASIITARALAPLDKLFSFSIPHLAQGGQCLFLKGERLDEEIAQANDRWVFEYDLIPSLTEKKATLIWVRSVTQKGSSIG